MNRIRLKSFFILVCLFFCVSLSACRGQVNEMTPIPQPTPPVYHEKYIQPNDYYVLALSWAPEYCKKHRQKGTECRRQPEAYRFVLHGLWPSVNKQASSKEKPKENIQACSTKKPKEDIIAEMLPIIPSRKLIEHEWEKHGSCSGLNPTQFFHLAKQAFEGIKIPDFFNNLDTKTTKKVKDIKDLFLAKNPNLKGDSVRVVNVNRELSEIRVCLDKSLRSIDCPFPPKSKSDNEIVIVPPAA